MGDAIIPNNNENITAQHKPHQKAIDAILLAFCSFCSPNERAKRLAPPTANKLETAVSITKTGAATVIAAVWLGSFSIPTK